MKAKATVDNKATDEFEVGDIVLILDGTNIPGYFGNFVTSMHKLVGQTGVIADYLGERDGFKGYRVRKANGDLYRFIFDGRGLEKTKLKTAEDLSLSELSEILGAEVIIK